MTQQRYMLIFAIGPVQSLIIQARKTRDLWLGSYLLAKLMEAAMVGIDEKAFVFPGKRTIEDYIPDIPNKYIAIFDSAAEAKQTAQNSINNIWHKKKADDIQGKWNDIRQDIWNRLFTKHPERQYIQGIWDRQTDFEKFFEVYWVAVPEPTEDEIQKQHEKKKYQLWLAKAQESFDARKLLRNFEAQQESFDARKLLRNFEAQDEPEEKSTISGEREVLHGTNTSREAIRNFWRDLVASPAYSSKDIDKDGLERLDAIDTIKRFALYSPSLKSNLEHMDFPSTSSIAAASFTNLLLEKLSNGVQDHTLTTALQSWLNSTGEELAKMRPYAIPYLYKKAENNPTPLNQEAENNPTPLKQELEILKRDGDCFFEETFADKALQKNYPGTRIDGVLAVCALKNLLRVVGAGPSPYYALIQMDGDHVGTILGNAEDEQPHRDISSTLSNFARKKVRDIVQNEHPGRLVYAGGDDALAFSPLVGLLNMVDALQDQYRKALGEKATASTGIAIAHHYTPLSLVRQATLAAEQLAKKRYGRNALVVTIMRRSGEQTRVGCHWRYEELKAEEQPLALFREFYRLLISDQLSESSIHVLIDEAPALIGLTREAQQSEIKRILQRKQHDQNDQADENNSTLPDAVAKKLAEQVVRLAAAMDKAMDKEQVDDKDAVRAIALEVDALRVGLVEVFGWLLVMAFLAREEHHLDIDVRERMHVQ